MTYKTIKRIYKKIRGKSEEEMIEKLCTINKGKLLIGNPLLWVLLTLMFLVNSQVVQAQNWMNDFDVYSPARIFDFPKKALEEGLPGLEVKGFIQNETGVNLYSSKTGYQFNRIAWLYELDLNYKVNDTTSFRTIANYLYDSMYDWTDPEGAENIGSSKMDQLRRYTNYSQILRECYLDHTCGDFWLRLGKQQIDWGKVPGQRVTDIINPLDNRYYLDTSVDYEHSKIPLWMANINWVKSIWRAQLLIIPDFKPNLEPPTGILLPGRYLQAPRPVLQAFMIINRGGIKTGSMDLEVAS